MIDLDHFRREGWVRVENVVPSAHVRAAIDAICAFHDITFEDPSTWYRVPVECWDMVPIHHAQAIWNIRQLPSVHRAFATVLGTERLWVTMDRSGFKAPARGHPELQRISDMHWDGHPREDIDREVVQGMIYLTDTGENDGAFECVPELFRDVRNCLARTDGNEPDITGQTIVRVPGRAGDLVIWNALLPHRGGRNDGVAPRITQYVSMKPARGDASRAIAWWREKRVPDSWRDWPATVVDPEPGPPAELTALGRKLVGLDPW